MPFTKRREVFPPPLGGYPSGYPYSKIPMSPKIILVSEKIRAK
jgi:hypothetical protein